MNCNNVNFLGLILNYSYIRCYHCMKLGEGNMGSLCTVFLHFSVNLYFQKKKKKKSDGAMHEKANIIEKI